MVLRITEASWLLLLLLLLQLTTIANTENDIYDNVLMDIHANPKEIEQMLKIHHNLAVASSKKRTDMAKISREFLDLLRSSAEDGNLSAASKKLSGHPLNLFYLFLYWRASSTVLRDADSLELRNEVPGLGAFLDNLPGEKEVRDVALSVVRLQSVYNISARSIAQGYISNRAAIRLVIQVRIVGFIMKYNL